MVVLFCFVFVGFVVVVVAFFSLKGDCNMLESLNIKDIMFIFLKIFLGGLCLGGYSLHPSM